MSRRLIFRREHTTFGIGEKEQYTLVCIQAEFLLSPQTNTIVHSTNACPDDNTCKIYMHILVTTKHM